MAEGNVARIYAEALFRTACREEKVEEFASQLRILVELVERSQVFQLFLAAPKVPLSRKEIAIGKIVDALGYGETIKRLFILIVRRHRIKYFPDIFRDYGNLVDAYLNRVNVVVDSAHELENSQVIRLEKVISELLMKEPRIKYQVDPDVSAGIIVRVNGKVYDSSLAGRLVRLREKMINGESERDRSPGRD